MFTTLLLTLSLVGPVSAREVADTGKAQPRPAPGRTTGSTQGSKPAKPAKPVGEPVLKRRHPGY